MNYVRPKKGLGQHFLRDKNIAAKIVRNLDVSTTDNILEIGPGKGVLSQYLKELKDKQVKYIELDKESVDYLRSEFHGELDILHADFLKTDLSSLFEGSFAVIGNFPYNISSQIFFRILEYKHLVTGVVGMVQKEVAERIASPPGSKNYGILSVFLQAYYDIDYLFSVNPSVFEPPPKVKSAVIKLKRNGIRNLNCNEKLFFNLVKAGFNQRRKILRNSLKSFLQEKDQENELLQKRPEQLGVDEFVRLTNWIDAYLKLKKH